MIGGKHSNWDGEEADFFRFYNNEKIGGIPNKTSPLVITTKIANFYVSQVLIDGRSSYDIMYL